VTAASSNLSAVSSMLAGLAVTAKPRAQQLEADTPDGEPADGQRLGDERRRQNLQHLPARRSGSDLHGGGGQHELQPLQAARRHDRIKPELRQARDRRLILKEAGIHLAGYSDPR
jgi:hypothetical protein